SSSSRKRTCRTRTTAGPRASSRCWISWRPLAAASSQTSASLLLSRLDLLQVVVLRRQARALAARPAELHRLFGNGCRRSAGAVGLDHYQARVVEQLLRLDLRFLVARLFTPGLLVPWLFVPRLFVSRLGVPGLFVTRLSVHGLCVVRLLLAL